MRNEVGYSHKAEEGGKYGSFENITHVHVICILDYTFEGGYIYDRFDGRVERPVSHNSFVIHFNPCITEG